MNALRNTVMAALVAAIFLILGAAADSPSSMTEAQDVANEAAEAWIDSDNLAARNAIAKVLCESELGSGSQVFWTHEGDLVCRPGAIQVVKGGQ
jgi:hypothetical protein